MKRDKIIEVLKELGWQHSYYDAGVKGPKIIVRFSHITLETENIVGHNTYSLEFTDYRPSTDDFGHIELSGRIPCPYMVVYIYPWGEAKLADSLIILLDGYVDLCRSLSKVENDRTTNP